MAGRKGSISQTGVVLAGAAAKTAIQLVAPANQDLELIGVNIGFHGTSNSEEGTICELVRQSSAGTSSALTPQPTDDGWSGTLQATARHTATVEPTTGVRVRLLTLHPQHGGSFVFDPEEIMIVGGARLGLRFTTGTGVAAVVDSEMIYKE